MKARDGFERFGDWRWFLKLCGIGEVWRPKWNSGGPSGQNFEPQEGLERPQSAQRHRRVLDQKTFPKVSGSALEALWTGVQGRPREPEIDAR